MASDHTLSSLQTVIVHAVQNHRDAIVALAESLIAIPTENPPGNRYDEAVQLLRRHLQLLEFEDTQVIGDCLITFVGRGKPTLYFSGHYDVVPAQSQAQFVPVMRGTNLFGRGSADMKGGLAAMIYAAKAAQDAGALSRGRIGLVFVPDEETAGPRGSRALIEQGLLGHDAIGMLTPEPTSGIVWNANRGAITLKITVRGKSAHVGRQHEGVNAFEQMLRVAAAFEELKREVEQRTTAYRLTPETARRSILMMGGQCAAGANFNVVPDSCSFTVDRRINPEEDFQTEKQRLLSVVEELRESGINVEAEVLQEGASSGVAEETSAGQALAQSIAAVTGRAAEFQMCPGLLEIRFYAERSIPAYAYGPGLLSVSHGPHEFVSIDRLMECAAIYALTAASLMTSTSQNRR